MPLTVRFYLVVAFVLFAAGNSHAAGDHAGSHTAEPESLYLEINQQCPDKALACYVPGLLKIASEHGKRAAAGVLASLQANEEIPRAFCIAGLSDERKVYKPPAPYELQALHLDIKQQCPGQSIDCYEAVLLELTNRYGPRASLDVFTRLREKNEIKEPGDGHHIAHHIGHHTAVAFGAHPEALALCTTQYNYGCIHGFFQYSLGKKMVESEAATKMCDGMVNDPTASDKDKAYCYHGLGHGVMMYADYDVPMAIGLCNQIEVEHGQMGCWQGMFMENVNEATQGRWERGGFSTSDPLAPCNRLQFRYQHECYINHAGWLMHTFEHDFQRAIRACESAHPRQVGTCIEAMALMVTNPGWQKNFLGEIADSQSMLKNASMICERFPARYRDICAYGGVDNLLNFDQLDTRRSVEFCNSFEQSIAGQCFARIGVGLSRQVADLKVAEDVCRTLDPQHAQACISGLQPQLF